MTNPETLEELIQKWYEKDLTEGIISSPLQLKKLASLIREQQKKEWGEYFAGKIKKLRKHTAYGNGKIYNIALSDCEKAIKEE